ncbi:MAG: hypothetical protein ACFB21_00170, partial [Opitutales bacterium]
MKPRERFGIVEFTNRSGTQSYRVTGRKVDGTRVRKNFESYQEAVGEKSRLELEATNQSIDRVSRITSLSDSELSEAEGAFHLLGERSLFDAVNYYLNHYREPVREVGLSVAFNEFLQDKLAANCRPLTLQNLRVRVGGFVRSHQGRAVADISAEQVRDYIHRPGLKPSTKDNHRRALSSFFTRPLDGAKCVINSFHRIATIRVDRDEPTILAREQIERLLAAAQRFRQGALLPYIAISLFAGVRPN